MFHIILAALMVVLTFSMPFATLAQQKSVQTEISEAAAAQDRNAMILEIKVAAEQDAINDIDDFLWFSVGLGIAYVAGGAGGLAGYIVGDEISPSVDAYLIPYVSGPGGTIGLFVGAAAGALASIIAIYKSPVHVPAGRLIGKSPEYVEFYTDIYRRKMRALKTGWAAAGTATGCGVSIIGCLMWSSQ